MLPDLLRALLTAPGPSGTEGAPAGVWREAADAFAEVSGDVVGSSVARVKGTGDGPLLIVVNVLRDLALAGYVFALLQQQRIAHEKQLKVRYLPHQQAPAAARAVQRPVSGTRTSRTAGSRPARVPVRKVDTAMVPHSAAN